MSKIKVTLFQMDTIWENPELNLKEINRQILLNHGADLFILPEMFNTGFTQNVEQFAEDENGYTLTAIKEMARISEAAICGSMLYKEGDKYYNAFVFVKPDGQIIKYYKRHIFRIGMESEKLTQGKERVVINYLGVRLLLQICYDLRFPVWNRNSEDYDAIINVANWPAVRRDTFDTLLKARAIENLCFVLAVNRIGVDANDVSYNGGTQVFDYKGELIAKVEDNVSDCIKVEIETKDIEEYKKVFPAHLDRDNFQLLIN